MRRVLDLGARDHPGNPPNEIGLVPDVPESLQGTPNGAPGEGIRSFGIHLFGRLLVPGILMQEFGRPDVPGASFTGDPQSGPGA